MIIQLQPAGVGCACGGACASCRGMGDVSLSDLTLGDLASQVEPFLTQQVGPLPMWAWAGGAFLLVWWLSFPSGSEYRRKRAELKSEYTGVAKIRRRKRRVASGLKQVVK